MDHHRNLLGKKKKKSIPITKCFFFLNEQSQNDIKACWKFKCIVGRVYRV